jgi:hypothetical protein
LPLFESALAAIGPIDFNGNDVTTDSFDSGDPLYSTNGIYNPATVKDHGDISTDTTISNSLDVGTIKVKGSLRVGPGYFPYLGTNTTVAVGNAAWVDDGNTGIQPGYLSYDMNVAFPHVSLPTNFNPLPLAKLSTHLIVNGVSYDYAILASGDYVLGAPLSTGLYIGTNVAARLHFSSLVNITNTNQIHISYGAWVEFYMNGGSFALAGNGIVNDNPYVATFTYFGLPSNTNVSFGANANFVGAIYAPDAAFSLGAGSATTYDLMGSIVARTIKLNGSYRFHFDEYLKRAGLFR